VTTSNVIARSLQAVAGFADNVASLEFSGDEGDPYWCVAFNGHTGHRYSDKSTHALVAIARTMKRILEHATEVPMFIPSRVEEVRALLAQVRAEITAEIEANESDAGVSKGAP